MDELPVVAARERLASSRRVERDLERRENEDEEGAADQLPRGLLDSSPEEDREPEERCPPGETVCAQLPHPQDGGVADVGADGATRVPCGPGASQEHVGRVVRDEADPEESGDGEDRKREDFSAGLFLHGSEGTPGKMPRWRGSCLGAIPL